MTDPIRPRRPHRQPAAAPTRAPATFTPAQPRPRHDGWSPDRQVAFVEALAQCGCVVEACGRVGMSVGSAYALRARPDAGSLRAAWDAALDCAVERLSDAVFARALNGVARPVFHGGEQIGERRYYDERLAMFVLRHRDPVRYGVWNDRMMAQRHPDGAAVALARAGFHIRRDAALAAAGEAIPARPWIGGTRLLSAIEAEDAAEQKRRADNFVDTDAMVAKLAAITASLGDVASTSSTSDDPPP